MNTGTQARDSPEVSQARFSIRHLLVVMAVVAVMATIGRAYLLNCPPDIRPRVLGGWAIAFGLSVAGWVVQFYRRRQAERQGGRTLLQMPMMKRSERTGLAVGAIFSVSIAWFIFSLELSEDRVSIAGSDWSFLMGALTIFVTSRTPMVLWRDLARFGEFGIVAGDQFLPWDALIDYEWSGNSLKLYADRTTLELQRANFHVWLIIEVPAEKQEAVELLLDQKANLATLTPGAVRLASISQLPLSSWFRDGHLRRYLPALGIGLLGGAELLYLGLGRDPRMPEFGASLAILGVLFAWQALLTYLLRRRNPGRPVARVFARRDWLGFLTLFAAANAIYFAAAEVYWSLIVTWPLYLAAIVFYGLTYCVVAYFMRMQLDLCEHGIALRGALFWPWQEVTVHEWNPATGRLVFARRLRRLIAFVPPMQRPAVSALLSEKLAANSPRST